MARTITSWQNGKSGNLKGRPAKPRPMAEMLRMQSEEQVSVGGELMSGREALAKAVWQFITTGEVWLQGKKLEADSINDWLKAVKWLYTYMEPPKGGEREETEMVVRVIRVKTPFANQAPGLAIPHPPTPSPYDGEGEEETSGLTEWE